MSPTSAPQPKGWLTAPMFRWSIGIIAAGIGGMFVFEALNLPVFSYIGLPHEFCYLREPSLIWLHVVSDFLIGAAYVSISGTLGYLVYRASKDIPFHTVFLAFGLFIVSCGITHFMEVWVIWRPVYWLSGYIKVLTASASVATAFALVLLVPKIFRLITVTRENEQHRAEIERLNDELERFNYSVAHDLRAPLRSITGFGQILSDEFKSQLPPEAVDYVHRMQRSAARMDSLVNGLLRYATVGRRTLELRPVALEATWLDAVNLLEEEIRNRSGTVRISGTLPKAKGDETLLQVVFQNLIANALKFSRPGIPPVVEISSRPDATDVVLYVTDNGIGFPPAAIARVFGMFERFHPEHPGTGIGLAMVNRAVQRMEGSIKLEPAPDRVGSRFCIRLPKA